MSDLIQAENMLKASQRDLKALTGMLDTELFPDEIFGLHTQQSVEKSLKAWLAALGETYPYTHDINRLLGKLEQLGHNVSAYETFVPYTEFAAQVRYVGMANDADPIERESVLTRVKDLYGYVSRLLESATQNEIPKE